MSIQIHNAHDAIFKTFFTDIEVATNFITIYLPKHMKQACDFSTLKIEPGSFVDADLKQHHSDILYSLKVNGMRGYVYLNLEHQSTAEELMPFRMHRYKVAIMQQHLNQGNKKLPVVISMLFYHGKGQYPYRLKLIDCVEDTPFAKAHFFDDPLLIDLNVLPDEEIYRHKQLAFLEIVQKHIFTRDLEDIADHIIKLIKRVKPDHDLFNQLVYYMLVKGETANVNQVIEKLKTIEDYEEDIMNAAQQLKQQGRQEGLYEGRQEGLQKGEYRKAINIAKKMLAKRINLPLIKEITGLSDQDLLTLEE